MWDSSQEMADNNCKISSCTGQIKAASKQWFESSWERKEASRLAEWREPGSSSCSTSYCCLMGGSVPVSQICCEKSTTSVQWGCRESCRKNLVAKPGLELHLCHRSSYTEKRLDFGDRNSSGRSGTTTLTSFP